MRREIMANGVMDFNFTPGRDSVTKIKFLGGDEDTHLRVYLTVEGKTYISDIKLSDSVATLKPHDRYYDQPIFNVPEH